MSAYQPDTHTDKVLPICWDKEGVLKRVRNKPERLLILIQIFNENITQQLNLLSDHIHKNELVHAKGLAHAIKGSAGNIGANLLMAAATELETALDNASPEDYYSQLEAVKTSYSDVKQLFDEHVRAADGHSGSNQ